MIELPIEDIRILIEEAPSITILTHLNPDADTLGTGLGIYNLLKQNKSRHVEMVNASAHLPIYLDFLPSYSKIKQKIDFVDSIIIACDCGSIDRLGFDLDGRKIINIDHHASNDLYGTINAVLPTYASASQVAYVIFKEIYTITKESAECFYAALLSDTRYFTTTTTNKEVFHLATELVECGVEPEKVAYHFTQRKPLSSVRILEKALSSLRLICEAKIATMYVTQKQIEDTGATMPDMEGIVDYGRGLVTVEVALFVVELKETIRVSLRSKTVDVSQVALAFGGGGHKFAAGFTLNQCRIDESIDKIVQKIIELGLIDEK